jgi:hypothetical protein
VAASSVRVAVFFDWQNVYKTAREAFGRTNMPDTRYSSTGAQI